MPAVPALASAQAGSTCFLCLKAKAVCDMRCPCSRCVNMNVPQMCISADTITRRLSVSPTCTEKFDPSYIMNELVAMKNEQRKLYDEVTALRRQNARLEQALAAANMSNAPQSPAAEPPLPTLPPPPLATMNSATAAMLDAELLSPFLSPALTPQSPLSSLPPTPLVLTPLPSTPHAQTPIPLPLTPLVQISAPRTPPDQSTNLAKWSKSVLATSEQLLPGQALVIFDLTQTPATVLNATDTFCRHLGYHVDEVLGMPWLKLIHPDFISRTMSSLQCSNVGGPVDMEQLYRHKAGAFFHAVDTHRIFLSIEGQPLLDVVSVKKHPTRQTTFGSYTPEVNGTTAVAAAAPAAPPPLTSFPPVRVCAPNPNAWTVLAPPPLLVPQNPPPPPQTCACYTMEDVRPARTAPSPPLPQTFPFMFPQQPPNNSATVAPACGGRMVDDLSDESVLHFFLDNCT
eukprot:TRINITY_DN2058_c0_g1_i1.p1 TRINITY_DN2058_c0_g1~~TRINITY_DN2058_c0_g1_i1.p1  ORF type:complete len:484 (-),score=129.94 TRINITY_DN2058_c0_g1_i1:28-1395(-)